MQNCQLKPNPRWNL